MAEQSMKVTIIGRKPGLMTHNPASMINKSAAGSKKRSVNDIPPPEVEAEAGTYRLPDGTCGIPGVAPRNAIVAAATAFKAKRGRASLKGAVSHIMVEEELIPLIDPESGELLNQYAIDIRRCVLQGKNGVVRARPLFPKWQATFSINYDPDLISPDDVLAILAHAGQHIGIGDYRPQKSGWFGRFEVAQ